MASDVQTVIENIQGFWRSLPGINSAPKGVTEGNITFPFAVTYEASGLLSLASAGWGILTPSTVYSELHVSQTLLDEAIKLAYGFRTPFLKKFISDPTLDGAVETVVEIRYTFGRLEWSKLSTIGYRFEIVLKEHLQV